MQTPSQVPACARDERSQAWVVVFKLGEVCCKAKLERGALEKLCEVEVECVFCVPVVTALEAVSP